MRSTATALNKGWLATVTGLAAMFAWSASVGLIHNEAERFGPIGGGASFFTVAGLFTALFLGVPRPSSLSRMYLWYAGALFVAYEICFAVCLGLAQNRQQALELELAMINFLWPCLALLLAVACRQQRPSWLLWPGIGPSFAGVVWLLRGDSETSVWTHLENIRGNGVAYALAAAAAVLWAATLC
jgi:drug/metabolite transporter (DMT)-like permease